MNDVSFANQPVLLLLALVPVFFALWVWGVRRAERRVRSLSRSQGVAPPYLAAFLLACAACAAIVGAARPQWGTRDSQVPRTGADLVVVLDISRSMNARDVAPNRLSAAQQTIAVLTSRLAGDRLGLVVFAGSARVRFPLTTDTSAALKVVQSLETGAVFVEGGSDAALGLGEAVSLLSDEEAAGRVILLLTDGDDLGGDPASAARTVAESGASLLVAGVGTVDGGVIPVGIDPEGADILIRGDDGEPVVSSLNEAFLRAIAAASGGQYLGSDLSVVPGVVDGRMRSLERAQLDQRTTQLPIERHYYFSAAALGLLVLAALAERLVRFGWRRGALVAVSMFLFAGCATDVYETNEAAREALAEGDTAAAIEGFLEVQVARPDDPNVAINLAAAYHAAGRFEEAIFSARRALESNNPAIRARAFASIGHHQFASNRMQESLSAFRQALLENPADRDSRHNYEVILRLMFPTAEPGEPTNGTPTPAPGGETPGNGGAEGTPTPGAGEATGTPQSGGPDGETPAANDPQNLEQVERRLREIDEIVARMIQEAGETPTPAEALEILEILTERSRIAALRDSLRGGTDPADR